MTLRLEHAAGSAVTVFAGEAVLLRYVYAPATPANESPRPYAHPVNTLAGDTLTNFRPNDHPWHHALSFTLNQVSGANFWGGPTCRRDEGYKWRDDHGSQHHVAWTALEAAGETAALRHSLEWKRLGETLFREERALQIAVAADPAAATWSLRWRSHLFNVSGRALTLVIEGLASGGGGGGGGEGMEPFALGEAAVPPSGAAAALAAADGDM